jgi:hypothetical protein
MDTAVPALPSSPADAIGGTVAGAAAGSGADAGAVAAKSGLVTGVSHCCFGSTGRVAVAVLKASNGPEALVAFTVSVPAGRNEISADSSSSIGTSGSNNIAATVVCVYNVFTAYNGTKA